MNTNKRFISAIKRISIFALILIGICLMGCVRTNKKSIDIQTRIDSVKTTRLENHWKGDSIQEILRSTARDYQFSGMLLPGLSDSIVNNNFKMKLEPMDFYKADGTKVTITRWKIIYKDTLKDNHTFRKSHKQDTVFDGLEKIKKESKLSEKETQKKSSGPSYHFWALIAILVGCTIIYLWAKIY